MNSEVTKYDSELEMREDEIDNSDSSDLVKIVKKHWEFFVPFGRGDKFCLSVMKDTTEGVKKRLFFGGLLLAKYGGTAYTIKSTIDCAAYFLSETNRINP